MTSLKKLFLLDSEIVFLNHGSFGATPIPVLDVVHSWQEKLEQQPVEFLGRNLMNHLQLARETLADYLHIPAEDLAYIPNVTYGLNIVARSLDLGPGDEILTTNHEYGACDNVWDFVCQKTGSTIIRQPIQIPLRSPQEFHEVFWSGVTSQTKVIYLSHITSPTAMRFPVEPICKQARERGILTVIDGAHAPGQMSVDLSAIDADIYLGNCHKWMLGPKGSGFIYTQKDKQHLIEPLVVSWGWDENYPFTTSSRFLDNLQWSGTMDPSAFLSVPAAIQFQNDHDWPTVRNDCHMLLDDAVNRICEVTGMPSLYSDRNDEYYQMAIAPLPQMDTLNQFQAQLYEDYNLEIPCIDWHDQQFIRVSVQGYNTQEDIDQLIQALEKLLPESIS
jgi:isopenicillin-N epimerase